MSELRNKMRAALSSLLKPETKLNQVPDTNIFAMLQGELCVGNDKAISIDLSESSGGTEFDLTICTFLGFELVGELDASGLFDSIEDSISLQVESDSVLYGALSTGVKITVVSASSTSPLEFRIKMDPILTQLYLQSDLTGALGLGLIQTTVSGNAELQGSFSIAFCPTCHGAYPDHDFTRVNSNSSFYFNQKVGYRINGGLELSAGVQGIKLGSGVVVAIHDDNVFDDIPAIVQLPDAQALLDSMKFSPQSAVGKFILSSM